MGLKLQLSLLVILVFLATTLSSQDTKSLFSIPGLSVNYLNIDDIGSRSNWSYFFNETTDKCGAELLEYELQTGFSTLFIYLRIDSDKVYSYDTLDCSERLIYDFDLEIGDVFIQNGVGKLVTDKTNEKYEDGLMRRKIVLENQVEWIEGIGEYKRGLLGSGFFSFNSYICTRIGEELVHESNEPSLAELCSTTGCRNMIVDFDYIQEENQVELINEAKHYQDLIWTFPDGTTTSEPHPTMEADHGCQGVTLAINNHCNEGPILKTRYLEYCHDSLWVNTNDEGSINYMSFANANIGLGISEDKIFKTQDGGRTWTERPFVNGSTDGDMFSVNMNFNGFAIITFAQLGSTDGSVIMSSTDYGNTWTKRSANTNILLNGIVTGDDKAFAERQFQGYFYFSPSQGIIWQRKDFPDEYRFEHFGYKNNFLYAIGRTTGSFADRVLVVGYSFDDGSSWQVREITDYDSNRMENIEMVSQNEGYMGGIEVLLRTTDGWNTWKELDIITNQTVRDIEFSDTENGWVTTTEGNVFHTEDGGDTWEKEYCLNENNIKALAVVDNQSAFLCIQDKGIFSYAPGPPLDCETLSTNSTSENLDLILIPNPTTGLIKVEGNVPFDHVRIYDLAGLLVYEEETQAKEIDLSFLESGIYLGQFYSNSELLMTTRICLMK